MRGGAAKSVHCRSWIAWIAFFVICLGASAGDLRAFPAFARKYRTR